MPVHDREAPLSGNSCFLSQIGHGKDFTWPVAPNPDLPIRYLIDRKPDPEISYRTQVMSLGPWTHSRLYGVALCEIP